MKTELEAQGTGWTWAKQTCHSEASSKSTLLLKEKYHYTKLLMNEEASDVPLLKDLNFYFGQSPESQYLIS